MKLWDDLSHVATRCNKFITTLCIIIFPLIYIFSGFYSIDAEQRGVVTRFGALIEENVLPGMHYHLPWPIESVNTLQVTGLRSIDIDFVAEAQQQLQPELTTGNADLVDVSLAIQYSIEESARFYHASSNPQALLKEIIFSETLYYIANNEIDILLTTGRSRFQTVLKNSIQEKVLHFKLGMRINSVQIRRLEPPQPIEQAFDSVARARSEKQKLIQEGKGERLTRLANARSEANRIQEQSHAYASEVVERARGDKELFIRTWNEYRQAPEITGKRLYLEQIENIFSKAKIIIINSED